MRTCTIGDCKKRHKARGMCAMHYGRFQRHGDPNRTVQVDTSCGTHAGYGRHIRAGEPTCQPCKDAMAAYNRERRANMPKRPKPIARGVPEGTPHCRTCERPMMGRHANLVPGWARRRNAIICTSCHEKVRRARKATEVAKAQAPVALDPALDAFNRKRRERIARAERAKRTRRVA